MAKITILPLDLLPLIFFLFLGGLAAYSLPAKKNIFSPTASLKIHAYMGMDD